MKILAIMLALLLAAVGLEWHGQSRGYDYGVAATQKAAQRKVDAATGERDQAIAERDAARQSLANVQRTLDAQKTRLQLANVFADAAMAETATLRKQLSAATAARSTALRKAAHDSPDCADLDRLPVCPAVSDRLWPKTAGDPAGVRH